MNKPLSKAENTVGIAKPLRHELEQCQCELDGCRAKAITTDNRRGLSGFNHTQV